MRDPNIVLDIIKKQSSYNNYTINNIYHFLYNSNLYIKAFNNLYNKNITNTIISNIDIIINKLRKEQYMWNKNKIQDSLLFEVLYLILHATYNQKFKELDVCKLFVHDALKSIYLKGKSCEFFIIGKINNKDFIKNDILFKILKKSINDNRFFELLRKLFSKYKIDENILLDKTFSDTFIYQNFFFKIISNIYLYELDNYINSNFYNRFNKLENREKNIEYKKLIHKIENKQNQFNKNKNPEIRKLLKEMRKKIRLLSTKANIKDCEYRRFNYIRYSNEFIISFTGTFTESIEIINKIKTFCNDFLKIENIDIKLRKSTNKKDPARFLNYNIIIQKSNTKIIKGKRTINGTIAFMIPDDIIKNNIKKYCKNKKPIHKSDILYKSVPDIIQYYQSVYKNIYQYYRITRNRFILNNFKWILSSSLLKTIARKFKSTVNKMFKKYKSTININGDTFKIIQCDNQYFSALSLKKIPILMCKIHDIKYKYF